MTPEPKNRTAHTEAKTAMLIASLAISTALLAALVLIAHFSK